MTVRSFLDSNVLVYTDDLDNPEKRDRAIRLIENLHRQHLAVVSSQVLQEYFVSTTRKLRARPDIARQKVELFASHGAVAITPEMVLRAIDRHRDDRLSYWDALIVEAASVAGCSVLYTEDLQAGRRFGALKVVNPFA